MARDVTYDLEVVDDIPERGGPGSGVASPLEDQLAKIADNPDRHHPKWGRIARYANAAAASSAANTLRKRHGDTAGVEGWRFEVRRIDNGEASGLFAQYNGDAVIPGRKQLNDERYKEYKLRQADAARARLEKKARDGADIAASDDTPPVRHKVVAAQK